MTDPAGGQTTETQRSGTVSTQLSRIGQLAQRRQGEALTTLAHHIDHEWLREAYRRTRKRSAPGIDGQTADYGRDLEAHLACLLERVKSGRYRAPAVRRVHTPKAGGGETRAIGIPTFEDKVLQRAVGMILMAVYEQDFVDGSYGFRPRRSAHQALGTVKRELTHRGGGWVVEIDIRCFFDTIDHGHLLAILRQRIRDGVLLRLIGKWLKAGVLEEGRRIRPEAGTPQGGVISPILANVFLHEVLDRWFDRDVVPRLRGRARLVRYADDAVLIFSWSDDASRVLDVLPKRFGKFGLALHPAKTRIVECKRPDFRGGPYCRGHGRARSVCSVSLATGAVRDPGNG